MAAPLLAALVRMMGTAGARKAAGSVAGNVAKGGNWKDAAMDFAKSDAGKGVIRDVSMQAVQAGSMAMIARAFHRPPEPPPQVNLAQELGGRATADVKDGMRHFAGRMADSYKKSVFSINPATRAEGMAEFGKAVTELPFIIRNWGEEMKQQQQHLAKFNAQYAATAGQSRAHEMRRNIESAANTSGSNASMVKSLDQLNDTLQPYKDAVTTITQDLLTVMLSGVNTGVQLWERVGAVDNILKKVAEILEERERNNVNPDDLPAFRLMAAFGGQDPAEPKDKEIPLRQAPGVRGLAKKAARMAAQAARGTLQ